jgi:MORN repeat variant
MGLSFPFQVYFHRLAGIIQGFQAPSPQALTKLPPPVTSSFTVHLGMVSNFLLNGIRCRYPWFILCSLGMTAMAASVDTTWVESRFANGQLQSRVGTLPDSSGRAQNCGLAQEWYSDGTLKSQIPWKQGAMEGDAIYFHSNGRKAKATHYQDGKKLGFSASWYANGQKQWEAMFQNDQANGIWREWHPNGKRKIEALYDRGKLNGHVSWWYPNGRLQQERDYQQGQSIPGSVKAYDSTGVLIFPVPNSNLSSGNRDGSAADQESH